VPGVEKVAMIGWPLMSGESAVGNISLGGAAPSDVFSDFVSVSPGWAELMRIPLLGGRDFRATDGNPGAAIVNQSFAKQYFGGADPVGQWFDRVDGAGGKSHFRIVGLIRDARSRDRMRVAIRPTAYIPFPSEAAARGTFVVRTATPNPLAMAATLRQEVAQARPGFRVRDLRTQEEFNQSDTVRERLLALLASFFAGLATLLAGVGLYGVLDYSVVQRRREIAIRMAIGARAGEIVRRLAVGALAMVCGGAAAGYAIGLAGARYVESLVFQVKVTELAVMAVPLAIVLGTTLFATLPSALRAARIDPASALRVE
jgi:putative ABC transport system permease protein